MHQQMKNIAKILEAFPNVKLKIGGYTDNTGSEEGNLKLSRARANAVLQQMLSWRFAEGRFEAEGYGSQHAVATNDTEEGRERNRRIALRVTQK